MANTAKYPVKTVETNLEIVDMLKKRDGARVTELAGELDMAPSAVHKHLRTLHDHRYVVKSGDEYRLGLRYLEMGGYTRYQREVYQAAKDELEDIAKETGEKTNLLVEEHGYGIYLYRSMGDEAIQVNMYEEQETYLHSTSLGKAILAHLPRDRVEEIIAERGMPPVTKHTITEFEELMKTLEEVRERGVAFDDEENIMGLRCVAAPILDESDTVRGAISVSAPKSRLPTERFRKVIPESLKQTANIIELQLN